MMMSVEQSLEWEFAGETEVLWENLLLCQPQIIHGLTWVRIRAVAVGSRRLTAWAMARPIRNPLTPFLVPNILLSIVPFYQTCLFHALILMSATSFTPIQNSRWNSSFVFRNKFNQVWYSICVYSTLTCFDLFWSSSEGYFFSVSIHQHSPETTVCTLKLYTLFYTLLWLPLNTLWLKIPSLNLQFL
jgi:hypothetical protein